MTNRMHNSFLWQNYRIKLLDQQCISVPNGFIPLIGEIPTLRARKGAWVVENRHQKPKFITGKKIIVPLFDLSVIVERSKDIESDFNLLQEKISDSENDLYDKFFNVKGQGYFIIKRELTEPTSNGWKLTKTVGVAKVV